MPAFSGILDKKGGLTAASDRGLSTGLWKNIPAQDMNDPRQGFFWIDDFHGMIAADSGSALKTVTSQGSYDQTIKTAGTFDMLTTALTDANTGHWGIASADCASSTVNQGVNIQGGPWVTPADGMTIVFEARVQALDIATGPDLFLGLGSPGTTAALSTAADPTIVDNVGWNCATNDSILIFEAEDTNTPVVGATSPHTLLDGDTVVDGTEWVKLGIRINGGTSGPNAVECFVNGDKVDVAFATDPVPPTGAMQPTLVVQSSGTVDSIILLDWWAVGVSPLDNIV
jgi:hypothetical protein